MWPLICPDCKHMVSIHTGGDFIAGEEDEIWSNTVCMYKDCYCWGPGREHEWEDYS